MTSQTQKINPIGTMNAAVIHRFGSPEVIQFNSVPIPKVQAGEVLVRIYAASVNPLDYKIRSGKLQLLTGKKFPRVLGCDFAGEIVDIGSAKTEFTVGTRVFGMLNGFKGGGYAEYVSVPPAWLARTPSDWKHEEASAIPVAARTAWKALHHLLHQPKPQSVLINGASGGVGMFAVQLARILEARVTAVCRRDAFNFVMELGADRVLDYREMDFTQSRDRYDLVFDVVGNRSFCTCAPVLKSNGLYITTAPSLEGVAALIFGKLFTGKKALILDLRPDGAELTKIARIITENQLRPIIGQVFPLSEAANAHIYGETQHPRGKIVLTV